MKKASSILLLVSEILAFVAAGGFFIAAIVMFVLASPVCLDIAREMIENGTAQTTASSTDEAILIMQATFLAVGIAMVIATLVEIATAVVVIISRKKMNTGFYVADIVLGALSGMYTLIAGAILGLFVAGRDEAQNS